MYMEEQPQTKVHRLTLQNRQSLQITGVMDVIAYDPGEIILETSAGLLMIKGSELHMNHLSLEKGETGVDGTIDSLTYSESHHGTKQAERFFGRLFK
jgi:sporulation protein YabP